MTYEQSMPLSFFGRPGNPRFPNPALSPDAGQLRTLPMRCARFFTLTLILSRAEKTRGRGLGMDALRLRRP